MEQRRVLDTEEGELSYILIKKRIKNLNLKVKESGEVLLSVPECCPAARADEFIRQKSGWIKKHIEKQREQHETALLPEQSRRDCYEMLLRDVERVYPLVKKWMVPFPEVRIRVMRSQWGNCHWSQGYITLNVALHRCPEHLRCYVALHELVHFLHHDHGTGFYALMDALMPDWRDRRRELRKYAAAIPK